MSDGFVSVGKVGDFTQNAAPVDITDKIQAVAPGAPARMLSRFDNRDTGEPFFASVESTCTHRGCPILTGDGVWGSADEPIYDAPTHVVTCPCHNSRFNVATGAVVKGPATKPLLTFATDVRGDEVFVAIAAGANPLRSDILPLSALKNFGTSASSFPGAGNTYVVDFGAFVVELLFHDEYSLTYTGLHRDGSRGQSETVAIETTYLRDFLFMVTWVEADKTTVVHIEDYDQFVIHTNITSPDLSFSKFRGTFRQVRS